MLEAEILLDLGYEELAAKTISKVAPKKRWQEIRCARIMAHRNIGDPKALLTQFPEGQEDLSFYTIFSNIERNILQLLLQRKAIPRAKGFQSRLRLLTERYGSRALENLVTHLTNLLLPRKVKPGLKSISHFLESLSPTTPHLRIHCLSLTLLAQHFQENYLDSMVWEALSSLRRMLVGLDERLDHGIRMQLFGQPSWIREHAACLAESSRNKPTLKKFKSILSAARPVSPADPTDELRSYFLAIQKTRLTVQKRGNYIHLKGCIDDSVDLNGLQRIQVKIRLNLRDVYEINSYGIKLLSGLLRNAKSYELKDVPHFLADLMRVIPDLNHPHGKVLSYQFRLLCEECRHTSEVTVSTTAHTVKCPICAADASNHQGILDLNQHFSNSHEEAG